MKCLRLSYNVCDQVNPIQTEACRWEGLSEPASQHTPAEGDQRWRGGGRKEAPLGRMEVKW